MLRQFSIATLALCLTVYTASAAAAACNESLLRQATDRYIVSQSTGSTDWLQTLLADNATYFENGKTVAHWTSNSTLAAAAPLRIDRSSSIFDLVQCASFTALISTDATNPRLSERRSGSPTARCPRSTASTRRRGTGSSMPPARCCTLCERTGARSR